MVFSRDTNNQHAQGNDRAWADTMARMEEDIRQARTFEGNQTAVPIPPRPISVSRGLVLLWIGLGLSLAKSLFDVVASNASLQDQGFFALVLGFVVISFLIEKTGQGKNWARITLLALQVVPPAIGWLFFPALLFRYLSGKPVEFLFSIGLTALSVTALVFLFQRKSNRWFAQAAAIRSAAQSGKETQQSPLQ